MVQNPLIYTPEREPGKPGYETIEHSMPDKIYLGEPHNKVVFMAPGYTHPPEANKIKIRVWWRTRQKDQDWWKDPSFFDRDTEDLEKPQVNLLEQHYEETEAFQHFTRLFEVRDGVEFTVKNNTGYPPEPAYDMIVESVEEKPIWEEHADKIAIGGVGLGIAALTKALGWW